ncbi:hypothetical protein [Paenibacillus azoreducens]|uniref:Lipoprotein n=1 Tax=Paenibacillus azoreducens TaxID=116718 RepID=A0A919YF94_9BACL|nr:hypothetical protein [Paenibacillus azoreducens]GIO49364.1 hypothetical protein J34TS1_41290 [Paenibacillus azoreducens]
MKGSKLLVIMSLLLLFFTGCFSEKTSSDKVTQLSTLNGESEHWQLQGYKLKIEGDTLFAGDGELHYKLDEKITDHISFKMVAVIDDKEIVLQEMKIVSSGRNFNKQDTGKAELKVPMNNEGEKITFINKDKLYGVIEWISHEGKRVEETIKFSE